METVIFSPLENREPISRIVASQIEEAILSKKYLPGSKLPSENELCRQFGVSRTSIREALQILVAQGFVTILKGKGMFVNEITPDSVSNPLHKYLQHKLLSRSYVLDIVHARQMIEPPISYTAALNHKKEDIIKLKNDIEELKNYNGSYEKLAELDMKFHLDLANSTQNAIMPILLDPIHRLTPQVKSVVYATVDDAKESAVVWHSKILDAVISRDPLKAQKAMEEHLKIAEEHAERMLKATSKKKTGEI